MQKRTTCTVIRNPIDAVRIRTTYIPQASAEERGRAAELQDS